MATTSIVRDIKQCFENKSLESSVVTFKLKCFFKKPIFYFEDLKSFEKSMHILGYRKKWLQLLFVLPMWVSNTFVSCWVSDTRNTSTIKWIINLVLIIHVTIKVTIKGCQFEPYNWLLSCLLGTVEVDLHNMPLPALTKRECGLNILDNRRE